MSIYSIDFTQIILSQLIVWIDIKSDAVVLNSFIVFSLSFEKGTYKWGKNRKIKE
jgi:hypothetical protein